MQLLPQLPMGNTMSVSRFDARKEQEVASALKQSPSGLVCLPI